MTKKHVNAGTGYTLTATFDSVSGGNASTDNYNVTGLTSNAFEIKKATFTADDFTYTAPSSLTYDGNAKSATVGFDLEKKEGYGTLQVLYSSSSSSYVEAEPKNADTYYVFVRVSGATNYNNVDALYLGQSFEIGKATYDMSGVSFAGQVFVEDGTQKQLAISGELPAGVQVHYEGNGASAFGVYEVVAKFTGDAQNYFAIEEMRAIMTINQAHVEASVEGGEGESEQTNVIISSEQGIAPDLHLVVLEKQEADPVLVQTGRQEAIAGIFDISLVRGEERVQPDGLIEVRLRIPEEIGARAFRLLHLHDGEASEVEYTREGEYAVFTTSSLSDFVFIADNTGSSMWLIILLAVLLVLEIILISVKKKKRNKLYAIGGGAFGGVLAVWEIALVAVLGAAVVACGIWTLKLYLPKKKAQEAVAEGTQEVQPAAQEVQPAAQPIVVPAPVAEELAPAVHESVAAGAALPAEQPPVALSEAEAERAARALAEGTILSATGEGDRGEVVLLGGRHIFVRYNRSFLAKLIQAEAGLKDHYAAIANALLSYKKVKCRMSWAGATFRLGRKQLAKLAIRGKTLYVYLAFEPARFEGTKYRILDASARKRYSEVPALTKVRSARSRKYALELIALLMQEAEATLQEPTVRVFAEDFPYESTEALIARALIKVRTARGAQPVFEEPEAVPVRAAVTVEEAHALLSDDSAAALVSVESGRRGGRKYPVNIDELSAAFASGDVVDLAVLKERNIVPKREKAVKILARGRLDKALTVRADDFSADAVKMITLTGGKAIRV